MQKGGRGRRSARRRARLTDGDGGGATARTSSPAVLARVSVGGGARRRRIGIARFDKWRRARASGCSLRGSGRRGGLGGEWWRSRTGSSAGDFSPEWAPAADGLGRSRRRRSEARKNTEASQGGVQDRKEKKGEGEVARGAPRSPEMELPRRRTGGKSSSSVGSLGALAWCYQGQKREEEEGV